MTESHAESASRLSEQELSEQELSEYLEDLRCLTMPAVPTVYALEDPEEVVTAWVFALPGGRAYIVSREDEGILAHTSLERVVSWWAPWEGADVVVVAT